MLLKGVRRNNYDISFRRSVKQVVEDKLSPEAAITDVDVMIERYIEETGDVPANVFLESMADAILSDMMTDTAINKMSTTEYPILSGTQELRRTKSSGARGSSPYNYHEVPLVVEEVEAAYSKYAEPYIYANYDKYSETLSDYERYSALNKKQRVTILSPAIRECTPQPTDGRLYLRKVWADSVKKRDKYRCQKPECRSRNGIMHAHHIKNYADNPELRFDTDNGVTLCERCHTDFHSLYGKKYTNGVQLREFFDILTKV